MGTATQIAQSLARYFLETGQYEDVSATASAGAIVPASATTSIVSWTEFTPFAGLAVRAVGAAEGDNPTCFVYVTRATKKMERELETSMRDVQVRVRKVGRVFVRPEAALSSTNRGFAWRRNGNRIACGSSIAPAGAQLSGTLGAILRAKGGAHYALSNNHVIGGCNHMPVGQPITSPSGPDVAPGGPAMVQFGTFSKLVELRSGDATYVPAQTTDAAIAQISDVKLVTSWQGDHYDSPSATLPPKEGLSVEKVGRTTGHTRGYVESRIVVMLPIPYKDRRFSAVVNYANVWAVRSHTGEPFALPGDSGSLVVSEGGEAAVGLLFAVAGSGETAFITDISAVLHDLGGGLSLASGV
jgi:hypothetical protein